MIPYFVLIFASFLLGACGKKGPVEPLEPSEYPRTYPKPPSPDLFPSKEPKKKDCCDDA